LAYYAFYIDTFLTKPPRSPDTGRVTLRAHRLLIFSRVQTGSLRYE
jgi:hypothetical protein